MKRSSVFSVIEDLQLNGKNSFIISGESSFTFMDVLLYLHPILFAYLLLFTYLFTSCIYTLLCMLL